MFFRVLWGPAPKDTDFLATVMSNPKRVIHQTIVTVHYNVLFS